MVANRVLAASSLQDVTAKLSASRMQAFGAVEHYAARLRPDPDRGRVTAEQNGLDVGSSNLSKRASFVSHPHRFPNMGDLA